MMHGNMAFSLIYKQNWFLNNFCRILLFLVDKKCVLIMIIIIVIKLWVHIRLYYFII